MSGNAIEQTFFILRAGRDAATAKQQCIDVGCVVIAFVEDAPNDRFKVTVDNNAP